jgi:hypothetical protein
VSHALGKSAQHGRQQGLAEPWGHHSVCAFLRACHGRQCPPGPKGVGKLFCALNETGAPTPKRGWVSRATRDGPAPEMKTGRHASTRSRVLRGLAPRRAPAVQPRGFEAASRPFCLSACPSRARSSRAGLH